MKFAFLSLALIHLSVFAADPNPLVSTAKVVDLQVESLRSPATINTPLPRFSWRIETEERGWIQKSYHILVASTPELLAQDKGDLWDSGEVASGASLFNRYGGPPLVNGQAIFWKVRVVDQKGIPTPWSGGSSIRTNLNVQNALPKPLFLSDTPRVSSFECSNKSLNEAYASAAARLPEISSLRDISLALRGAGYHTELLPRCHDWLEQLRCSTNAVGYFPSALPNDGTFGSTTSDAGIVVPYSLWWATGDPSVVERSWPSMFAYVVARRAVDPELKGAAFGELPNDSLPSSDPTPPAFFHLASEALNTRLLLEMGKIMGKDYMSGLQRITAENDAIRKSFRENFFTNTGQILYESLSANVVALRYGLLDTINEKEAAAAKIAELCRNHSGNPLEESPFVAQGLLPTLSWTGRHDLAMSIASGQDWKKSEPTTLVSVSEWLISMVAGIRTIDAGSRRLLIQPTFSDPKTLSFAKGTLNSPHGTISSSWRYEEDGLSLEIILPPNTSAQVRLPVAAGQIVTSGGAPASTDKGLLGFKQSDSVASFILTGGRYVLEIQNP